MLHRVHPSDHWCLPQFQKCLRQRFPRIGERLTWMPGRMWQREVRGVHDKLFPLLLLLQVTLVCPPSVRAKVKGTKRKWKSSSTASLSSSSFSAPQIQYLILTLPHLPRPTTFPSLSSSFPSAYPAHQNQTHFRHLFPSSSSSFFLTDAHLNPNPHFVSFVSS